MAYFKNIRFAGIAPGVAPRLLAEQFGQTAENIDFESGRLVPTKDDTDTYTLQNGSRRSIYFYRDTSWLEWSEDGVDVVPGPIANDTNERLYFTGDDYPRVGTVTSMVSGSSGYPAVSYRLGVPAPSAAPTTAKTGSVASDETPETRAYVYTLVTDLGEEGPPSSASTTLDVTSTETVTVTMPTSANPSGNYFFSTAAKKRIYRSNTGSNFTDFQFVGEVAFATTSFSDSVASSALGEVLPSGTWIGPPDDDTSLYPDGPMLGLTAVGNGVMAGFSGKRFCLSEPFLPHAWPIDYRITLEEDIVDIAATGNGVVALTNGTPYFITGTDPAALTPIRVDLAQACVNKNSVVDMGEYVLYAAPDGLVAVSGSTGEVVSRGLISVEQWNANFHPTLIRAFRHEGTYVAFYNNGGTLGGWYYDPRSSEAAFSTITVANEIRGGVEDPKSGQLYVIEGNKIRKYRGGANNKTLTFKSKKYTTPSPVSMAWVSVHAEAYPVTVKVYGDGALIAHYAVSESAGVYTQATTVPSSISNGTLREPIMRLPAKVATEWEVEVSGAVTINEVCLAQSMDEIRAS
tara:strand:- start:646 stop:2364 length:1719 start_codon:yes stop_codon:yes gene_type:complete